MHQPRKLSSDYCLQLEPEEARAIFARDERQSFQVTLASTLENYTPCVKVAYDLETFSALTYVISAEDDTETNHTRIQEVIQRYIKGH